MCAAYNAGQTALDLTMPTYDVYAIGNALVDSEYRVSDEFLQRHSIQKGLMTLVDAEHQKRLLEALHLEFPCVKRASGGSAANSIIAVAAFGGRSFYSCKVASDAIGDFYVDDLHAAGVHSNLHQEREEGVSGTCVVMVTPDAERTMNTFLGITSDVSCAELIPEALTASRWLYIEGYLCTSDSARQAVSEARRIARGAGIPIAMTFSDPAMARFFKPGLEEMLAEGVDLLFCNEEEALSFTGEESLEAAVEALFNRCTQVVVTRGPKGALIASRSHQIEVAAPLVEAVDTNGAGDMFAGAYLFGLSQGYAAEKAAHLATFASAEVVQHLGPRLPLARYTEILENFTRDISV